MLMRMVLSQAQNNERGAVNFVAFAFSTSGELCPAAVALVERIVQTYRRKLSAEGPRDDGLSTAHLTHLFTSFRFEFHVAIQVAIARGVSGANLYWTTPSTVLVSLPLATAPQKATCPGLAFHRSKWATARYASRMSMTLY